jgi:hypothetical protein
VVVLAVLALSGAAAPNALAATGSISGTVTGAPSHAGVPGVEACAWETKNDGEIIESKEHCAFTGSDGDYEIGQLGAGTYLILFWPRVQGQNYIPQFYDQDGLWPTDSVTVGDGPTTGIDMELPEGGSIRGQLTEEVGSKPLAGVMVCATRQYEDSESSCAPTDADGKYEIVGLRTYQYTLKFSPDYSGLQYFGEYYDDKIIGLPQDGPPVPVSVTAGSVTTGIDAALKPAAEIRGVVTAAANGAPLSEILVCVAPTFSFFESSFSDEVECSRTSDSGAYAIKSLKEGQYKVLFSLELRDFIHYFPPLEPEEDGYPTRYWREKNTLWDADVLTLTAPTVATAIDARLGPSPPISSTSPSSPPLPPAAPRILKRRCKPGQHLRKVRGKRRCVRQHPRKHRRHRPPRPNAHRSSEPS